MRYFPDENEEKPTAMRDYRKARDSYDFSLEPRHMTLFIVVFLIMAVLLFSIGYVTGRSSALKEVASAPLPLVSLMGYTNAGKSTLMNRLTAAGVHVEDQLFSTLDPTVRRMRLPSGREILLADTVGFIKRLPHQLVASFKATFEEMAHADLLIEVVDSADQDCEGRIKIVEEVLAELGLADRPRIRVFNKCDLIECSPQQADGGAFISPSPRLPRQACLPVGRGEVRR